MKSSFKVATAIVTLGGSSRLEEAKKFYQLTYEEYQLLHGEAQTYKYEIDKNVMLIGESLTKAKVFLEKLESIIRSSIRNEKDLNFSFAVETLDKSEEFNSAFNSVFNIGAGAVAGGSMAVGSWALVTALGSASTGTAISSLSGAAATNATLAWFGGGALAAGGAGMSGGIAVLGGIAAIPFVYIAAKSTHKKAGEFEEETIKLAEQIVTVKKYLHSAPEILCTVQAKKNELTQICEAFVMTNSALLKVIRPYGFLSLLKQKLLTLVGKNPLTSKQTEALDKINHSICEFLGNFQKQGLVE